MQFREWRFSNSFVCVRLIKCRNTSIFQKQFLVQAISKYLLHLSKWSYPYLFTAYIVPVRSYLLLIQWTLLEKINHYKKNTGIYHFSVRVIFVRPWKRRQYKYIRYVLLQLCRFSGIFRSNNSKSAIALLSWCWWHISSQMLVNYGHDFAIYDDQLLGRDILE